MERKSAWDKFFDDTEDIQCISCLDASILEYFIDDCLIRVERVSDRCYVYIIAYDEDGKRIDESEFTESWKEKNIYNQAVFQKFSGGYFFHE